MEIRERIKQELQKQYGSFDSYLENIYLDKIIDKLAFGNKQTKIRWSVYNQVIIELKHSIKDKLKLQELMYLLTDDKNPNIICIDVIKSVEKPTPELERLYLKIMTF
jgi:hypothetical protein